MNISRRRPVFICAPALLLLVCCDGTAQVSGSVGCGGAAGAECPGQQTTISARVVPGGELQIGGSAGGPAFGMREASEVVRDEPYQAQAVTAIQQTLANGTHIDQTITATVARDREGRTVRSQKLGVDGPFLTFSIAGNHASAAADAQPPILTTIFDPVAKEHIDFTSNVKIARVMPISAPLRVQVFGRSEDGPVTAFAGQVDSGVVLSDEELGPGMMTGGGRNAEKVESLGKRTIEGVRATGTRRVWTIPVGAIGNDRTLVTTEDTWYSAKLKLVLLSVRDDPRFGKTTYSLLNLKLTNPERSLFKIPPGYTVETLAPPPPPPGNPISAPPQ
jgi:hypothetical protein